MDISTKLAVVNKIQNFPIGEYPKTREELLAKASIVLDLSKMVDGITSEEAKGVLCMITKDALDLSEGEKLPSVQEASNILKLSNGFIQDYGKVQYLRENNQSFDEVYDLLISIMRDYGLNSGLNK